MTLAELAKYRKALVAVIGVLALVVPDLFSTVTQSQAETLVSDLYLAVVGILTAYGVFRVPNEEA